MQILNYSGDTDGAVPTIGTMRWIEELEWNETSKYRPFFKDQKTIGYHQGYDGMDFIVIHGAGHVVPMWEREIGLLVAYSWIFEEELPWEF